LIRPVIDLPIAAQWPGNCAENPCAFRGRGAVPLTPSDRRTAMDVDLLVFLLVAIKIGCSLAYVGLSVG
jgi:hypothetical protein